MSGIFNRIFSFIKKQVVLVIAWFLAIVSSIYIRPSFNQIVSYIDWRSLSILLSLMAVVQAFALNGFFSVVSVKVISSVKRVWQLVSSLVLMCFFFSMVITNDVALITFVPLTIMILNTAGLENLMIVTVVLETIAANTGSMLTPIGNPQNLYLYNLMNCSALDFIRIMLPYTACSLVLLMLSILFVKGKKDSLKKLEIKERQEALNKPKLIVFAVLGIIALLTVFKVIPYYISLAIVVAVLLIIERRAVKNVDYMLLLTFIGFFIFTGNLSHNKAVSDFLGSVVSGKEVLCGALVSQVISNVPCALLLSSFAQSLKDLTIGVNIGGLGTLIASMASLISYKFYAATTDAKNGKYICIFTVFNVVYLMLSYSLYLVIR